MLPKNKDIMTKTNTISVKIEPAKTRGYNFQYEFSGHRRYIEINIRRYIRILSRVKNIKIKVY